MSSFAVSLTMTTQSFMIQIGMESNQSVSKISTSFLSAPLTSNAIHQNCMELETAIIASSSIPSGISTLPFVSHISIKRILNPKPVNYFLKAFVSTGVLCIDQHLDWIPLVRIACNCYEQNLIAFLSHNDTAIVLQTTRTIEIGEELKVWLSPQLITNMNIPFLTPNNIINENCYRCNQCGITFCQPNPLKVHISFECCKQPQHISSQIVRTQQSSSAPIQPIREQRSHTCVYCGKIYTRKYGLKIHVRTHTGQKPLRCRFCGRPFSDPSNLNKHVRLHSQNDTIHTSPYKCKQCAKVLVRRRDLERHIKSRHQ